MGGAIFRRHARRQRRGPCRLRGIRTLDAAALRGDGKAETGLPSAHQFRVDFGEKFGVQKRAVLGAARIVDSVARTQIVELVGYETMAAARQSERIDNALARQRAMAATLDLGVEEGNVETRIVRDEPGILADEGGRRTPARPQPCGSRAL